MNIQSQIAKSGMLKLGSSGDAVKQVQFALAARGYPLKGTGYFGPATDTAVESFQARSKVTVDGVVGINTARLLDMPPSASVATASVAGDAGGIAAAEIGRPLWLQAGLKLIGTKEASGAKDNAAIIDWAHDEGGSIAKEYTHDSIPWCALFANHCLTKAGIKGTETLWALDFAGKWPSIKLGGPAVGAFAPMLRDGGGHIIQVVGKDSRGNIMGLGGNQSDQVSVVAFPVSRLNKGFWWPSSVALPTRVGICYLPVVKSNGEISSKES